MNINGRNAGDSGEVPPFGWLSFPIKADPSKVYSVIENAGKFLRDLPYRIDHASRVATDCAQQPIPVTVVPGKRTWAVETKTQVVQVNGKGSLKGAR